MAFNKLLSFNECLGLSSGYLVTINLQHLYESSDSLILREAIFSNPAARLCADGRGARQLFQRESKMNVPLVVGNEVLRGWLDKVGIKILIIGSDVSVIDEIISLYQFNSFTHNPSRIYISNLIDAEREAKRVIQNFGKDYNMIALALGVPKQELLAQALTLHVPEVPILCIGGSFEMIAARYRRAPLLFQNLGLEGAWRLVMQPNKERLNRLINSYWNYLYFTFKRKYFIKLVGSIKND